MIQNVLAPRAWNSEAATPDWQSSRVSPKKGGSLEDAARIKDAAKEFEALFLNHLLTIMRQSTGDSGLLGKGLGQDTFTELFDQEVARLLAARGALGVADLLIRGFIDDVPEAE